YGLGHVLVREAVREDEEHALARADFELAHRRLVRAAQRCFGAQHGLVGPGDGAYAAAVREARHPGHVLAVVEAQDELHAHRHAPTVAPHDAHDVGHGAAYGHEVDHGGAAVRGLELRFEDQGVRAVGAPDARRGIARRDEPASVPGIA